MKAINPRLKYVITTFLHDISEALSSIPCCALGGSDPDMIAQADFIAALLKIEFTGPSGEKFNFTPQQVAEIFNRGDVEKKRYISRKVFLNFWTAEARDSFVEEPSQHNQSNNIRRKAPDLQNLQGQIKASGTALKESQSLARHKIVHLRAQAKADLLRKRAMETTESCVKKIEKANLTMRIQQGIIENGTAKEPSIKKAQGIFLSAKKLLATAQSELERAKKQEAAAMVASAEASDAADAVDDASGAVDYFEEIRTYIQQLASPQGIAGASDSPVHKLFRELDVNQDGRLSSQELGRGIKDLLKELNIVVKRGGVELVCGWLDSDGSGFIEPEEFLDALSPSSFFQRGRNGISFEGLPCLARYHGHAQIFLEGSAGEVIPWQPLVAENQQARGHFFAATVGPMRPDGCFKAAFTRQRTSETSLYRAFSNFPISKNIIFQSCGKDDIYIHCKVGQERAVELFAERAAQSTRSQLIQLLVELISSTTMLRPSGPNEGTHSEEPNAVVRAIELGQLSRIIFDPDLGLLRIWKESTGSASKEGRDRKSTSEFQVKLCRGHKS
jgi:Ca2+-binding EF-hand superfamily protein